MTEEKRIQSIVKNGGRHLKSFKEERITYAMCLAAVGNDGSAIYFVPQQYRTQEVFTLACKTHGAAIEIVPIDLVSREMCEAAVSSDGLSIFLVPDEFRTKDLYLLAARNNPLILQKMPADYLTTEFCIDVCMHYGKSAIGSLPKSHKNGKFYLPIVKEMPDLLWVLPQYGRTITVCKAAIESMGYASTSEAIRAKPELLSQLHTSLYDHDTCLAFAQSDFFKQETQRDAHGFNSVEDREKGMLYLQRRYKDKYSLKHLLRWKDVCDILVQYLPECIPFIADDVLTYEMCLVAVSRSHHAFYHVPDRFKSRDICMLAFEKEPYHIERFPTEHLSHDLWLKAVSYSGFLLKEVPPQFMSREICLAAIRDRGSVIEYAPEEHLDEAMCLEALQNIKGFSYGILGKIPERLRTYPVCLLAVTVDTGCYQYVPEEHKTYELCLAAAKKGFTPTPVFPNKHYTEELCVTLVQTWAGYFKTIPRDCLTETICLAAVNSESKNAATVLTEIPDELITQEMCDISIEKSIHLFRSVPERFVTEDMLFYVAKVAPGCLSSNFPKRHRNKEFTDKLINRYPAAKWYIDHYKLDDDRNAEGAD